MEATMFTRILEAVKNRTFKDEKLDVLESYSNDDCTFFSADQVAELVKEFTFDDEKVEAVKICSKNLVPLTCVEASVILKSFGFDDRKVKALKLIGDRIIDPEAYSVFDDDISFSFYQSEVKRLFEAKTQCFDPGNNYGATEQATNLTGYNPYMGNGGTLEYNQNPGYGDSAGFIPAPEYAYYGNYDQSAWYTPAPYGASPEMAPLTAYGPYLGYGQSTDQYSGNTSNIYPEYQIFPAQPSDGFPPYWQ
ncbi:uncharacterized protein LOC5510605 [Nematostella vectensis]|uniref:uncharacterized protein LOC5510605 n=1 Tax=Nematostella vectensis TaxID=45351 RepID=UPI00207720F4|nr:uncharacterized protein LOC5510605 [Nematostella vectensis]